MPWAVRAGVDPRRGSFFVHSNIGQSASRSRRCARDKNGISKDLAQ